MGEYMSFLKDIQRNSHFFELTNGAFPEGFELPKNVNALFNRLFQEINPHYLQYCADFGIDPNDLPLHSIKKDKKGNCYWEVVAADGKTKIIIIQDDVDINLYIDKDGIVNVSDCSFVTKLINPILDEADPISESYILDVCSMEKGE